MAEFGFEVFGQSGVLQASSEYITMGLSRSGRIVAPMTPLKGLDRVYGQHVWFSVTGTNPIPFIAPGSAFICRYIIKSGSTFFFGYDVDGVGVGSPFQYYVFDNMTPRGTIGIEVFNASGVLTFTSNRQPLRVVYAARPQGVLEGGKLYLGMTPPDPQTYAVLPAGSYAINSAYGRFGYQLYAGVYDGYFLAEQFACTSTGYRWSWLQVADLPGDSPAFDTRLRVNTYGYPFIMIIDTTRLPAMFA